MRLVVRLTPKSSCDRIDGWDEDGQGRRVLKVRVRAAPIEGQANIALVAVLAKVCGVPKSRVRLVAGETSRLKTVDIDGVDDVAFNSCTGGS